MTFTTRPELAGTFGMVSSTHWLASATGMAMLERGGNAFDAAVAAGFVLQVVEPHLNGPGGEAPIVAHSARDTRTLVICGQGPAPERATIDDYRGLGLELIPGSGLLAACVPGAFGAWITMLRDLGTMELRDVLEPAISYARNGYPLVPLISDAIASVEEMFLTKWPSSAEVYLGGGVPQAGSLFANPAIADTYERIVKESESSSSSREARLDAAIASFYEGFVAATIARFVTGDDVNDEPGDLHRGFIAGDDLASWRPPIEAPLRHSFLGLTVNKTAPWSQGLAFQQQLSLLNGMAIGELDHNGTDYVHAVVECAKLAFADREAWYGDPDFVDVPVEELLSDGYAAERVALVTDGASLELRPGAPGGRTPRLMDIPEVDEVGAGAGEPTMPRPPRPGDTVHVCAVDRAGNMVAATPSGGWLQSSPVIPGLGFPLGTRAQMFWLVPDLPNSLSPGKRPRTTLSPTLVERDGEPYMAFGTPGGDQQDQWSLTFFLTHALFGANLQEAIDVPAFHTAHFPSSFYPRASEPGSLYVEERIGADVVSALESRGHVVTVTEPWSLGRMCAVASDDGVLKAGANPRGMQGYAIGR